MKLSFQSSHDGTIHVHAEGCRDINKPTKHPRDATRRCDFNDEPWYIEGETAKAILCKEAANMNADFEAAYAVEELFRIFPCVKA